MATSMDIILKRPNKVYHPGETLYGAVLVSNTSKGDVKHEGVMLQLDGLLSVQLSPRTQGLIDTFVNSPKPTVLQSEMVEVCKPGRLPPGQSELAFEVPLPLSTPKKPIYETFHGNCINIHYSLRATMKRSLLTKPLVQMIEFIVEHKPADATPPSTAREFTLSPNSVSNAGERARLPQFSVTGHIDTHNCSLSRPLTGQVCVERCNGGVISSIELQLHRLETCGSPAHFNTPTEVSEVQGWQVCDGDVQRGLIIPLCLPLPRAFTCATHTADNFAIGFQVSLVVMFDNDHIVTESFPLVLTR
uniref:Down syndrome critical region protein 3-like n=1 Tax=Hirondellea gigas TaxID=1518452 RepID=A0A2P2I9X0_9CRUS